MPFKFVANISRLFPEKPLLDRFKAVKDAGFNAVEITSPLAEIGATPEELAKAKSEADIDVVLLNACTGKFKEGQFGLTAIPSEKAAFDAELELAISYAKALSCKRLHLMAGVVNDENLHESMKICYIENLQKASRILKPLGISIQIEFICPQTIPRYFLNSGDLAMEVLQCMDDPNVELQIDIFHMQMVEGNLTENLKRYLKKSSYIQISQAPRRGEPDSLGEINYPYLFKLLGDLNYTGYIGLEYSPEKDTLSSLSWINDWGLM